MEALTEGFHTHRGGNGHEDRCFSKGLLDLYGQKDLTNNPQNSNNSLHKAKPENRLYSLKPKRKVSIRFDKGLCFTLDSPLKKNLPEKSQNSFSLSKEIKDISHSKKSSSKVKIKTKTKQDNNRLLTRSALDDLDVSKCRSSKNSDIMRKKSVLISLIEEANPNLRINIKESFEVPLVAEKSPRRKKKRKSIEEAEPLSLAFSKKESCCSGQETEKVKEKETQKKLLRKKQTDLTSKDSFKITEETPIFPPEKKGQVAKKQHFSKSPRKSPRKNNPEISYVIKEETEDKESDKRKQEENKLRRLSLNVNKHKIPKLIQKEVEEVIVSDRESNDSE
mmetsp:Transcript_7867/g.8111  ORF Transcript_7867/g.8111 Transcript_7867/m.8111 type:complete len:335 (+) Transcript_7867:175-1179(+)